MPKLRIFALVVLALFAWKAGAQSPMDGHVAGKTYVNRYFHFTYTWPAILQPYSAPATDGGSNPNVFLLFSARQGNQSLGVRIIAEKLNVVTPHSAGVKSSAEYIDRLAGSLRPGPMLSGITRLPEKTIGGVRFNELDYVMDGQPFSTIATQIGQYVILFRCNAKSEADIAAIRKSVLDLKVSR